MKRIILALLVLPAAAPAATFTVTEMEALVSGPTLGSASMGSKNAQARIQRFYHYFKRDRDPSLVAPSWLDRSMASMLKRPAWRDSDGKVYAEPQLWQAPALLIYEFFELARRTFPSNWGGNSEAPGALLRDGEDLVTRFSLSVDRLRRARPALNGRERPLLTIFQRIIPQMKAAQGAMTRGSERDYAAAVMAVAALSNQACDVVEKPAPTPR